MTLKLRRMRSFHIGGMMNNIHNYLNEKAHEYECPTCHRRFPEQYSPQKWQVPKKKYGTKQLLSLWAYYNFKRHLKACIW